MADSTAQKAWDSLWNKNQSKRKEDDDDDDPQNKT
jgi:hypothetical protein